MFDLNFISKDIKCHLDENGIKKQVSTEENISELYSDAADTITSIFK